MIPKKKRPSARAPGVAAPPEIDEKVERFETTLTNGTEIVVIRTIVTPAPPKMPSVAKAMSNVEDPMQAVGTMMDTYLRAVPGAIYPGTGPEPRVSWEIRVRRVGGNEVTLMLDHVEAQEFFAIIGMLDGRRPGGAIIGVR